MPEPNGDAQIAQAMKRSAELRKQVSEARDLIWLLRAHIARGGLDIGPEDDKRVIAWLTTEAGSER